MKEGINSLTSIEQAKLFSYNSTISKSQHGSDYAFRTLEATLMNQLKVSREEIAAMKKNPFVSDLIKALIIMAAVSFGGTILTFLIEKWTGADLKFVYIGISSIAVLCATAVAQKLLNVIRFRKLQKAYETADYQEELIQGKVFLIIKRGYL